MQMRVLAAVTAGVLAAGASHAAAPVASFDCAKAKSPVEKLICSDAGLAAADAGLASIYAKVLAANPGYAAGLKDGQRSWIVTRNGCLEKKDEPAKITCLKGTYRERAALLQGPMLVVCDKPKLAGAALNLACVAPNSPLHLSFALSGRKADDDAALTKLSITKAGSKPQVFKLDGRIHYDDLGTALELVDANFDGFADIKLETSFTAGPNMGYEYWLYVPKTGQFQATKLGDTLSGEDVAFDAKTKQIKVSGRGNCCSWFEATYAWSGGGLKRLTLQDSGEFTPTDLPGVVSLEQNICGSATKQFNAAGLITRIDVVLGSTGDYDCAKETLDGQKGLFDKIKRDAKAYRVEPAKDPGHFAVVFDTPKKPTY